jgi:hypothetical protein
VGGFRLGAALAGIGMSFFVARLEDVRLYASGWPKLEAEAGCALASEWKRPFEFVVVPDEPEGLGQPVSK